MPNNVANDGDPWHEKTRIKQMRLYSTSSARQVVPPKDLVSVAVSLSRVTRPAAAPAAGDPERAEDAEDRGNVWHTRNHSNMRFHRNMPLNIHGSIFSQNPRDK